MADAGVIKAGDRLPWLEPYRPPSRRPSNRSAGLAAMVGVAGLAGIATLLAVRIMPVPDAPAEPSAEVLLPPPSMIKPNLVPEPLVAKEEAPAFQSVEAGRPASITRRTRSAVRRRIKAEPTRIAYSDVVRDQAEIGETVVSPEAMAIALMPAPPADPPRPAVNPAARVVRGKTVQMGVYKTARQAEIAWRSAIRDYT